MDRRDLLIATGAIAVASLAGCLGETDGIDDGDGGDDRTDAADDDSSSNGDANDPSSATTADPDIPEAELQALARDNAAFGTDLYHLLAADTGESLFFSPYSISVALAMTFAGAAGKTAEEMEETLRFSMGEDVHPTFAGLETELAERAETEDTGAGNEDPDPVDAFQLELANALWGREGTAFAGEFLELVDQYYGAGLEEADFVDDPEGERERINAWVADRTEDRIDEVLPPNSISPNTVLVLTNAIYFLASWESEFDPDDTEDGTFSAIDGTESTVSLMEQDIRTDYADVDGAQAVELRYVGGDVSMVLLLPDDGQFATFEESLDEDVLFGIFDDLSDHTGTLELPKFEIETDFELGDMLADLGMPTAFGSGADFSGMFEGDGPGVSIDEVYHDAFVTIDEEGTEAAASTAVVMNESAPPSWGDLRFDRPFLFCIRDRPTNSVLFFGRVMDPADGGE